MFSFFLLHVLGWKENVAELWIRNCIKQSRNATYIQHQKMFITFILIKKINKNNKGHMEWFTTKFAGQTSNQQKL